MHHTLTALPRRFTASGIAARQTASGSAGAETAGDPAALRASPEELADSVRATGSSVGGPLPVGGFAAGAATAAAAAGLASPRAIALSRPMLSTNSGLCSESSQLRGGGRGSAGIKFQT